MEIGLGAQFTDTSESLKDALERTIAEMRGDRITLRELVEQIGEQGMLLSARF